MTARLAEGAAPGGRAATGSIWSRAWSNHAPGYMFLVPWFIGFFGLTIGPILYSLYLSFTNFDLLTAPQWTGADNYVRMFTNDPRFAAAMRVTFFFVLFSVPLKLAFALCVALMLNRGMKGLPLYRALFYLPSLLGASVAIAILWRQIFAGNGLVNQFLTYIGIFGPDSLTGMTAPSWLSNPNYSLWTLIVLSVWQFGSPMIIFLAGLRQVPEMYYDAAKVDGASAMRQFFTITLPLLTPIIFFNLVLQVIFAFQSFTQAFIVSGGTGGPADSTLFYTLYLYREGFAYLHMGYASAMAWFLLVVIAAFTAFNFWLSRFWVFYDD